MGISIFQKKCLYYAMKRKKDTHQPRKRVQFIPEQCGVSSVQPHAAENPYNFSLPENLLEIPSCRLEALSITNVD